MNNGTETTPEIVVDVTTHGEFHGAEEYARAKIGDLGRLTRRPISHVKVRLSRHHDAAVAQPVVAQANLDVQGRPVRAQVRADTAREAVDKLAERLRRGLERVAELWEPRRGPDAAPPWRRAAELVDRPRPVPDTGPDARIIRRKSYTMAPCTVDEAVLEMELLDYEFHLFTEIATGAAGVVYRDGPTGLRLALVAPDLADGLAPFERPVTVSPHPVPCLSEQSAVQRMALMDLPFLFFIDAAAGRVSVLYRRYDGQLGVLTPAG